MKHKTKGFTLVELLVVISIIAILSVIGITIFSSAQKSARDAKRKEDIHTIQLALEQYKTQYGYYPPPNGNNWCSTVWNDTFPQLRDSLAPFMSGLIPGDPTRKGQQGDYWYLSIGSGTGYELLASMEGQPQGTQDSSCHGYWWTNAYNLKVVNQQ